MENLLCAYCHMPQEKVECSKYENNDEYDFSFHEVITFVLSIISIFLPSFKKKLNNHKYKITCTNKDCIDYLKDCYVRRHQKTIWEYKFFRNKNEDK
jgi:hypothetical protein